MLRISPPQDSNDRRTKVYNFLEAIKTFPTNFSPEEIKVIMSRVNPRLYSRLRELFVVIDDDMEKVNKSGRSRPAAQSSDPHDDQSGPHEGSSSGIASGVVSGANASSQGKAKRGHKRATEPGGAASKSARSQ